MLLTSCDDNGELFNEEKLKIVKNQMQEKLSNEKAAKLVDSVKAIYGNSLNYVSDVFIGVATDTTIRATR